MNARGCSCRFEHLTTRTFRDVVPSSCGVCRRCGAPGHTRKPPGPLAKKGAWCDRCYAIVEWNIFPQMVLRAAVIGAFLFASVIALARIVAGFGDVIHDTLTEADESVSHCAGP